MEKPLYTIVADEDINAIVVAPNTLQSHTFEVGTAEYDLKHDWLVKNEYTIITSPTGMKVLNVSELIDPSAPSETSQDALTEKLEEAVNMTVTAIVFNRHTLESAVKEVKKRHVTAFAKACIENYDKTHPDTYNSAHSFAVVEIDFANKQVEIKSINPEE